MSWLIFPSPIVVDRVKKDMANRTMNNDDLVKNIKNKLSQFNQQLMDLRDALNEAVNNTAHTVEANNINQKHLDELQVTDTTPQISVHVPDTVYHTNAFFGKSVLPNLSQTSSDHLEKNEWPAREAEGNGAAVTDGRRWCDPGQRSALHAPRLQRGTRLYTQNQIAS